MCVITGRNEVVAKVIFLHLSVILFTGGSASVHAGMPLPLPRRPPRRRHHPPFVNPPQREAPPLPRRPPTKETPQKETPPWRRPPGRRHPPCQGEPPESRHPPGMRSMSDRYASYWNVFLLCRAVWVTMNTLITYNLRLYSAFRSLIFTASQENCIN